MIKKRDHIGILPFLNSHSPSVWKSILSFIIYLFCIQILSGQPQPCGAMANMANNCADACVICDIDGFTGRNDLRSGGQNLGAAFCSNADDMHFIAFIAGSPLLSIRIDVSNCQAGRFNLMSLDLGFYESLDCQNFRPITSCQRDLENGQSHIFETVDSLNVGQHYYLIMDGSAGSVCDWTFSVLNGSTQVLPLTNSGTIRHNEETCSQFPTAFTTELNESGAAIFDWTIDGILQPQKTQDVEFTFLEDGIYEVCVKASNVCDEAPVSCTIVKVRTPDTLFVNEQLCQGECREYNGKVFCETGSFQEVFTFENGCDSVIVIDLEVLPVPMTSLDVWICNDQFYEVGTSSYNISGRYIDSIPTAMGCDSIVTLDLLAIECEILGTTDFLPAVCHGSPTGSLIFSIDQGTPPLNFVYTNIADTTINGNGSTALLEDNIIPNVPAGTYRIYVADNFGNDVVLLQDVEQPPILSAEIIASQYGDYNLSCNEENGISDGSLSINPSGGVSPYTYLWSNGGTNATSEGLEAGPYSITITDDVGCPFSLTTTLSAPPSITSEIDYRNPSCDGFESGEIEVVSTTGGTDPYEYSVNGSEFENSTLFIGLSEGDYEVLVRDQNGCTMMSSSSINAPQIPIITLDERIDLLLGDSIVINPLINDIDVIQVEWSGTDALSCNDCLNPYVRTYNDASLNLSVTSKDECTSSSEVFINVIKRRRVLTANVFTPNGDGMNDVLLMTGGVEVSYIMEWSIFDRWGNVVFNKIDFLPDTSNAIWDGTLNGKIMPTGLYTWHAKVLYLDGEPIDHTGEVTLIR